MTIELQGLRTVIYPAPDLAAAKAWWTNLTGISPYFDEPFYVGFELAGYELGLLPTRIPPTGHSPIGASSRSRRRSTPRWHSARWCIRRRRRSVEESSPRPSANPRAR